MKPPTIAAPLAAQRTLAPISAIGAVAWALLYVLGDLLPSGGDPVSQSLAFAIGVVVPLGLSVVPAKDGERPYFTLLCYLVPPAQIGALASLMLSSGPVAGGAASLWVVASIVIAVMGLGRMRVASGASDRGVALAWIFLPVGAVWLVMARLGASPLHLSSLLVALTAAHFHYAAFAALTVVSMACAHAEGGARRALHATLVALAVAMVLVALGITLSPEAVDGGARDAGLGERISQAGAALFTLGFLAHAAALVPTLGKVRSLPARIALGLGALAPLGALPLAILYTFGALDLDTMITWHAPLNTYGFGGLSLIGWALVRFRSAA